MAEHADAMLVVFGDSLLTAPREHPGEFVDVVRDRVTSEQSKTDTSAVGTRRSLAGCHAFADIDADHVVDGNVVRVHVTDEARDRYRSEISDGSDVGRVVLELRRRDRNRRVARDFTGLRQVDRREVLVVTARAHPTRREPAVAVRTFEVVPVARFDAVEPRVVLAVLCGFSHSAPP